jgi:hypothetical protein
VTIVYKSFLLSLSLTHTHTHTHTHTLFPPLSSLCCLVAVTKQHGELSPPSGFPKYLRASATTIFV